MPEIDKGTITVLKAANEEDREIGAKSDEAFKNVMKDKHFLASILKEVVTEFADVPENEIAEKYIEADTISDRMPVSRNATNIKGISEEDNTVNESFVRYDVLFEAIVPIERIHRKYEHKGKDETIMVQLRIDFESQRKYNPGYPITKRAQFYCARLLGSEFGGTAETIDYNELYKVYSIWICFDVPDYLANSVFRIKSSKEDVYGHVEIPEYDYNLMESVIIMLGKGDSAEPRGIRLLEILYAFFGEAKDEAMRLEKLHELGFNDPRTEEVVNNMFSYSEMVAERAMAEGKVIGEAIGEDRGRVLERTDMMNAIRAAKRLYKEGADLGEISKECLLSEEELEEILN